MNRQDWIDRNIQITPEMDKVFDWCEKCVKLGESLEPMSDEWFDKVVEIRKANAISDDLVDEMFNLQTSFDLGEE